MNPLLCDIDPGGIWRICLAIGAILGICRFVEQQEIKLNIPLSAFWIYILSYCVIRTIYPASFFGNYNTAYQATAGMTFIEVITIGYLALNPPDIVWELIPLVVGIEILIVWFGWTGLFIAPSFDLAFIALSLPLLPTWLIWIAVVTILTRHGTTAQMILGINVLVYVMKTKGFRKYAIGSLIILPLIAYFHSYSKWFDSSERIVKWTQMLKIWYQGNIWFGMGPGTFMWQSLEADHWKTPSYGLYLQMHSDWLQILFETGLVAAVLALVCFYIAIKNSWKEPRLLALVLGAGAFALSYHPLRFFPSSFLIALIFNLSSKKESNLGSVLEQSKQKWKHP